VESEQGRRGERRSKLRLYGVQLDDTKRKLGGVVRNTSALGSEVSSVPTGRGSLWVVDPPVNWRATIKGPSGTTLLFAAFRRVVGSSAALKANRPGGTSDSSPAFQRRVAVRE